MGRLLLVSLPATGAVIYRCKHCDTHLAYDTDIIARVRVDVDWVPCCASLFISIDRSIDYSLHISV
jgi:hypothetical protein